MSSVAESNLIRFRKRLLFFKEFERKIYNEMFKSLFVGRKESIVYSGSFVACYILEMAGKMFVVLPKKVKIYLSNRILSEISDQYRTSVLESIKCIVQKGCDEVKIGEYKFVSIESKVSDTPRIVQTFESNDDLFDVVICGWKNDKINKFNCFYFELKSGFISHRFGDFNTNSPSALSELCNFETKIPKKFIDLMRSAETFVQSIVGYVKKEVELSGYGLSIIGPKPIIQYIDNTYYVLYGCGRINECTEKSWKLLSLERISKFNKIKPVPNWQNFFCEKCSCELSLVLYDCSGLDKRVKGERVNCEFVVVDYVSLYDNGVLINKLVDYHLTHKIIHIDYRKTYKYSINIFDKDSHYEIISKKKEVDSKILDKLLSDGVDLSLIYEMLHAGFTFKTVVECVDEGADMLKLLNQKQYGIESFGLLEMFVQ